jgi:methionyl-tRNA synthetase
MKKTLITSALPYANGYIHLGHCAGAYLPADIYARYQRLKGEEILYVCGSDEHGVAITIAAEKEKVSPKDIIDKYHYANLDSFTKLGMSFDIYSRTSIPSHHVNAREFFADFLEKGLLLEKEEEQFYDEKAKMFLPDRYVEGICPNCSSDRARGDQCDSCGAYYNQLDLKNPKSLVSGDTPIIKKTSHWYFQFSQFQEFLENYVESNQSEWKDNVIQQTKSWLKQGLTERAITRDLKWGVKIDGLADLTKSATDGKALYVWFEAVLGYISATMEFFNKLSQTNHKFKPEDWKNWWQNNETDYIAFIGKDNIVFHTIIFPALLKARGDNYILPKNVPANEFLNLEGQKFSKSRNWSIDLRDFLSDFPESKYTDALRYTLAMNAPETKDSDFTWKDFQARNNNELSAIFGNFINRCLQFISKNYDNKVPKLNDKYKWLNIYWKQLIDYFEANGADNEEDLKEIEEQFIDKLELNDIALIRNLWICVKNIEFNYSKFRFRDAISETMNIARAANKYFNDEVPWKTIKEDPDKAAKTLYVCVQLVNTLSILFSPIVPFSCAKIKGFLGVNQYCGEGKFGDTKDKSWKDAVLPSIFESKKLNEPEILFAKIEDDVINTQIAKLGDQNKNETKKEDSIADGLITIDDFKKIKLVTAKIISAENVPKSKKLIKMLVNDGTSERQVLAGIAEHYKPEELIGKIVVLVANLLPAKLMGLESNGMLLAANTSHGKLALVSPLSDEIAAGAEVR